MNPASRVSNKLWVFALLFAWLLGDCVAQERLLAEVPANVDRETALDIVRDALEFREWKIETSTEDTVVGYYVSGRDDVRITVRWTGAALQYTAVSPWNNGAPVTEQTARRQNRWTNVALDDIRLALRAMSLNIRALCRRVQCQPVSR